MADKNDGGDKTEHPTPKRLEDARKKGDVSKSREVTSTVGLIVWFALGALVLGVATTRLHHLWQALFQSVSQGWTAGEFHGVVRALGMQAAESLVLIVGMLVVPVALVGTLVEYLQAGPVFTFEKIKPKLDAMNPVEGVKKMFTMDNLIELVKSIAKTALLFWIGWLVVRAAVPDLVNLARDADRPPQWIGAVAWKVTVQLLAWTVGVFALVALLDAGYQRYSFIKKMRMSLRDIKQEMKESEGDPYIKGQRKQLHHEWSQRNQQQAARNANVLVVNPTHVAIAIDYDRDECPVPTIAAKGEDDVALAMREAAEEAGVPIVRNIPLARDLLARGQEGEIVPQDLFEIIAEVVLWAQEVRAELALQRGDKLAPADIAPRRRVAAPGEDLTLYPKTSPWNPSH